MEASEKLMKSLNETWEDKMSKTQEIHKEREKALEELGITVDKGAVGVHTPKKMPHLVNLVSAVCPRTRRLAESMYHLRTKVIIPQLAHKGERLKHVCRSPHERVFDIPAQAGANDGRVLAARVCTCDF